MSRSTLAPSEPVERLEQVEPALLREAPADEQHARALARPARRRARSARGRSPGGARRSRSRAGASAFSAAPRPARPRDRRARPPRSARRSSATARRELRLPRRAARAPGRHPRPVAHRRVDRQHDRDPAHHAGASDSAIDWLCTIQHVRRGARERAHRVAARARSDWTEVPAQRAQVEARAPPAPAPAAYASAAASAPHRRRARRSAPRRPALVGEPDAQRLLELALAEDVAAEVALVEEQDAQLGAGSRRDAAHRAGRRAGGSQVGPRAVVPAGERRVLQRGGFVEDQALVHGGERLVELVGAGEVARVERLEVLDADRACRRGGRAAAAPARRSRRRAARCRRTSITGLPRNRVSWGCRAGRSRSSSTSPAEQLAEHRVAPRSSAPPASPRAARCRHRAVRRPQ